MEGSVYLTMEGMRDEILRQRQQIEEITNANNNMNQEMTKGFQAAYAKVAELEQHCIELRSRLNAATTGTTNTRPKFLIAGSGRITVLSGNTMWQCLIAIHHAVLSKTWLGVCLYAYLQMRTYKPMCQHRLFLQTNKTSFVEIRSSSIDVIQIY